MRWSNLNIVLPSGTKFPENSPRPIVPARGALPGRNSISGGAANKVRNRIASPEMFPEAEMLPVRIVFSVRSGAANAMTLSESSITC
jgi:hypothetical protein